MPAICRFTVTEGLHCASCVARLEREMGGEPGVAEVRASLVAREATVDYDPAATAPTALVAAFRRHGFTVQVVDPGPQPALEPASNARRDALIAAMAAAALMAVAMGPDMHDPGHQGVAALIAAMILLGPGRRLLGRGLGDLVHRRPGMDSLVALSCLTAWGVSLAVLLRGGHHTWFESAGMTVALVLVGRWLEERARHATGAAVAALLARQPATALRIDADGEREVAVEKVLPGDRLRLRTGLAVPCVGVVEEGSAELDESAFPGEGQPVLRGPGARVA
ncbi:MAG: cation transporter, partial [Planctomycetes bacterium]|nr:cation transporter [Planctomycetota bacterium]